MSIPHSRGDFGVRRRREGFGGDHEVAPIPTKPLSGRVYVGQRHAEGDWIVMVEDGGIAFPLAHVVYHSPAGFAWGYGGSGPSDLSLSILADALGEAPTTAELEVGRRADGRSLRCWALHQGFKADVIAGLESDAGWRLPLEDVLMWVESREG